MSKFAKINWSEFEQVASSSRDYEETYIDGYRVTAAYNGNNVIAMYYHNAKFGTKSLDNASRDLIEYVESDTNAPDM